MSQDKKVNDVGDPCRSFVALGSVIGEDDRVFVLPFTGKESAAV
jgi:hypothetical protein